MQACFQQASVSLQGTSWAGRVCKLGQVRKQFGEVRCLLWDCSWTWTLDAATFMLFPSSPVDVEGAL